MPLELAPFPMQRDRLPQLSAEEQVDLAARQLGIEPEGSLGFEDIEAPAMPQRQPRVDFAEGTPSPPTRDGQPLVTGAARARQLGPAAYVAEQARLRREERDAALRKAEAKGHPLCTTCWFYDAGDAPTEQATQRFGIRGENGMCRLMPRAEAKKASDWCGQHRTENEARSTSAGAAPTGARPHRASVEKTPEPGGEPPAPSEQADVEIIQPAEAGETMPPQSGDSGAAEGASDPPPPAHQARGRHKAIGA